jgi:hypothetical protein
MINKKTLSEAQEQMRIFNYAKYNNKLKWLFAIPNGGYRDIREAKRLKLQGVKAGVCDMFLPIPNFEYHGLFIELKVGKNKTTESQDKFIDFVRGQGYKAEVCYGADDAIRTILNYLGDSSVKL